MVHFVVVKRTKEDEVNGGRLVFEFVLETFLLLHPRLIYQLPLNSQVSEGTIGSHPKSNKKAPMRKYGIGKGLMTVWRATNPDAGDLPIGFGLGDKPRKTLNYAVYFSTSKLYALALVLESHRLVIFIDGCLL